MHGLCEVLMLQQKHCNDDVPRTTQACWQTVVYCGAQLEYEQSRQQPT